MQKANLLSKSIIDNNKETIVLDMDGVLTDLLPHYLRYANTMFDINIQPEDVKAWRVADYCPEDVEPYIENIFKLPNFYIELQPVKGAIDAVTKLSEMYNIVIATDPYVVNPDIRLDIIKQKQWWILKYFKGVISPLEQMIFTNQKGWLRGDYIIDDNPTHLQNFLETNTEAKGIMFPTEANEDDFLYGTIKISEKGWDEVVQLLTDEYNRRNA